MLKHVTLLASEKAGKATWKLLGPAGHPILAFSVFAEHLSRRHAFNTRKNYCRHLAEFIDYLYEAALQISKQEPQSRITRIVLREIVESYEDYLVFGHDSGNRLAGLVSLDKPSPRVSSRTASQMHAAVKKFLVLSDEVREELIELASVGLADALVEDTPLFATQLEPVSAHQRSAMQVNSMIAGVMSGGPRLLKRIRVSTAGSQTPYDESRAFPFDRIEELIQEQPTYRDKAWTALLAASGCRSHEGLQLLFDDIDVNKGEVFLRNPRARASHPSYLALTPSERDRLAWKGRATERTVLIEPFVSMFFDHLEMYMKREYIPHGLHRFVFQFRSDDRAGDPYFLSSATARQDIFKRSTQALDLDKCIRGAHSLRHAYGTYALNYFPRSNGEYGLPLAFVQQLMGHASIKSTMRYARHDPDLIKFELQHANMMIFRGGSARSVAQLKLDALQAQVKKIESDLRLEGLRSL